MAHVLYRFYSDTGQLLYVGITMNVTQRFHAHKHTKDWWDQVVGITLQHYPNREDLAAAERRAIEVERPLHNIVRPKVKGVRPPEPIDAPATEVFNPVESVFTNLFKGVEERRKAEEQAREDWLRARWDAIRECTVCDSTGYHGRRICRHPEPALGQQRERLQVIQGGDADG